MLNLDLEQTRDFQDIHDSSNPCYLIEVSACKLFTYCILQIVLLVVYK